jgi:hypothetical protein
MTQELALLATLGGVISTIMLMFLPAIMELRNPKDAGPRLIAENFSGFIVAAKPLSPQILEDIEGETRTIMKHPYFLRFLQNLESGFSE